MKHAAEYWDHIGRAWGPRHSLWREFTDRLQLNLIASWLPLASQDESHNATRQGGIRILKTDLFDEVANLGLVSSLLQAGAHVTGIDLSPHIVSEAMARNPRLAGLVADVRHLPFINASFDAVFSGSTLDHLSTATEIDRALREIARVLRPGGILIITMDNPVNPILRLRNSPLLGLLQRIGIVPYQVGMTLAPSPLRDSLRAAGFDILETKSLLHCPRWLCVLLADPIDRLTTHWKEFYIRILFSWEVLNDWPTRWWTGHYIAVHAVKH